MTLRKWIFTVASAFVMLAGVGFIAYYLAWWGFHFDLFLSFSILITGIGMLGLLLNLLPGTKRR